MLIQIKAFIKKLRQASSKRDAKNMDRKTGKGQTMSKEMHGQNPKHKKKPGVKTRTA